MSLAKKTFRVVMSERCFRFKPDSLMPHAPRQAGVYEFVTFDANLKPEVLYVGCSAPGTLYDALAAHLMGERRPSADDLFKAAKDIYFDYVARAEGADETDLLDIAGTLQRRHRPRFNRNDPPASGRYSEVEVVEAE